MEEKKNRTWFWILNGAIAIIALVFIIENWAKVSIRFFGLEIQGAGFLIFLFVFALGFFSGWLWSYFRGVKTARKKQKELQDKA